MDETTTTSAGQSKGPEDTLAARREARRRKILENSNNRLSKIVGHELPTAPAASSDAVQENSTETENMQAMLTEVYLRSCNFELPNSREESTREPASIIYPDPEDERMEFNSPQTDSLSSSGLDFSGLNGLSGVGQNGDIMQLLNTFTQAQAGAGMSGAGMSPTGATSARPSPRTNSRFARVLRTKIHLIVASIAVYLLFATGNESYVGGNVFLPLLAWELLEIITFGAVEPGPAGGQQLLSIVCLLGGIPMKTSQAVMKLLGTVNKVLKDVAFFMFFFVLTHLLWSRLWLGIELRYVLGYDQLEVDGAGTVVVDDFVSST
uniref:Calcium signal-modulating cyclophilin ligand n=1 Tax=Anopheles atroparvus TaxID=41427 RepID=A0AAG5DT39_ANOAO